MSNETKIGLLAVITIVLSVIGYNFLKGINVINAPNIIYANYDNVASLSVSSPVLVNGLQVGVVKDMYFLDDLQTIQVAMNIEKDFRIPKEAEAIITSTGLMGGTAIIIKYDTICKGPDCAQNGDLIGGRVASVLEAFIGQPEELDPYFDNLKKNVGPLTDSIKYRLTDPNSDDAISKSLRDIAVVLENLKTTTASLNRVVAANAQPLNKTLKNVESLTGNLSDSNENIKGIVQNTDTLTANIARLEFDETLNTTNEALAGLKNTMTSADKAIGELTVLLEKINKGEGAVGKLMNDDSVITQFSSIAIRLDSVLTDFQDRPYRYIPLKSRKKVRKFDKLDGK